MIQIVSAAQSSLKKIRLLLRTNLILCICNTPQMMHGTIVPRRSHSKGTILNSQTTLTEASATLPKML